MTPEEEGVSPQISRGGGSGRLAALGALALVVVAVVYLLLFSGDDGHEYRLAFETGGQLVAGNEVLIGGQPVGSIESIELDDDAEAIVTINVDRPLHEGTSGVIRATSLSGIANRYISLTPGPDNGPVLDDGSLITQVDTTAPVDLDQLFNVFREEERKGLQDIIQGSATVYAGRAEEANETYRYLSPALSATTDLLSQVNRDQRVFSDFLVSGARVVTAVAERRDDLSGLISNSNEALGAIASQNRSFDRALRALPPALRQANTTFSNLRPTLDDLDGLVATAKPATKNLAPFLRDLKPVVKRSVPVFHDLSRAVNRKGKNNDLADAFGKLPATRNAAARAVPTAVQAMIDSGPTLSFYRPYAPEIVSALAGLNQATAYYDDAGHYTRVIPAGINAFDHNGATNDLDPPIPATAQYADYGAAFGTNTLALYRRCPGGATQTSPDLSNPFAGPPGGPALWAGSGLAADLDAVPSVLDCNYADVPPGP
jgi:phospholipid/cholesterol/gamma-HCH transport system substrate-binding protein